MTQPSATHTGAPRPDTSNMFAVHGVFRDTLGAATALVGGVPDGDADRLALVANCYDDGLSFLNGHHGGEEEDGGRGAGRGGARPWRGGGPRGGRRGQVGVVGALGSLRTHLVEHLDE